MIQTKQNGRARVNINSGRASRLGKYSAFIHLKEYLNNCLL